MTWTTSQSKSIRMYSDVNGFPVRPESRAGAPPGSYVMTDRFARDDRLLARQALAGLVPECH